VHGRRGVTDMVLLKLCLEPCLEPRLAQGHGESRVMYLAVDEGDAWYVAGRKWSGSVLEDRDVQNGPLDWEIHVGCWAMRRWSQEKKADWRTWAGRPMVVEDLNRVAAQLQ